MMMEFIGMARPNRLKEIEAQYGDLQKIIPAKVNELGSIKAAAEFFGTSEATLSVWLRNNGYVLRFTYVKSDQHAAYAQV
jgi:hypothetical protein